MPQLQEDDMLPEERALLEGKPMPGAEDAPKPDEPKGDAGAAAAQDDAAALAKADDKPAEAAAAADAGTTQAEQAAPVLDDDGDPVLVPVPAPKNFNAERDALEKREAEIEAKWASGEIGDEDRLKTMREIRAADRELTREELRHETLTTHNQAAITAAQQQMLGKLMSASKSAGEIDYTNPAAQAAYNAQLQHLLSTEFKDKDMRDWANVRAVYAKTHADLCAAFGVKKAAQAAAPAVAAAPTAQAAPAQPAAKVDIPPTLGRAPAADRAPIQNEFLTSLSGINDPDVAEALVDKQPKAVREAALRGAMPTAARRH